MKARFYPSLWMKDTPFAWKIQVKALSLHLNELHSSKEMEKQTIDTYKLTSMEEPSDEVLEQLMKEAAEDARHANEEATKRFFDELKEAAMTVN